MELEGTPRPFLAVGIRVEELDLTVSGLQARFDADNGARER